MVRTCFSECLPQNSHEVDGGGRVFGVAWCLALFNGMVELPDLMTVPVTFDHVVD